MKITMWLVRRRDTIYNAYPRKLMAEVYASGFSDPTDVEIIEVEVADGKQSDPVESQIRANCGILDEVCADCKEQDCPIVQRR